MAASTTATAEQTQQASADQPSAPRPLTILCLHGFRQNSSTFKGRLRALQRKLSKVATLVFLDAPYVLPLWYKPRGGHDNTTGAAASLPPLSPHEQQQQQHSPSQHDAQQQLPHPHPQPSADVNNNSSSNQQPPASLPRPKRAWLLSEELLAAQPELQALFQAAAEADAAGACPQYGPSQHLQQQQQPQLHPHDQLQDHHQQQPELPPYQHLQQQQRQQQSHTVLSFQGQQLPGVWQVAPDDVAHQQQYTTQDSGWELSWEVILAALAGAALPPQQLQQQQQEEEEGAPGNVSQWQQQQQLLPTQRHIDGLLGFSQGAAVAAVVAALCQQQQQQQQPPSSPPLHQHDHQQPQQHQQQKHQPLPQLKFVMLASGFVSPAAEHQALLQQQAPIQLHSLHMYASAADGGSDRQIQQQQSERLLGMFDKGSARVLTHAWGHMVPSDAASVAAIKEFLQQFL